MPKTSASTSSETQSAILELARKREAATREILEVISHSRDDDRPVFDAILQNATRLCGADSAALVLGTPEGLHLTLAALWQWDNSLPTQALDAFIADINRVPMQMDPALHVSAQAICGGKVVHLADAAQSAGYLSGERTFRSMVEEQGIRTILSVPLFDAMGTLGAINLHRREVRPFSDDEIALVETFAAQAVIAIENVRQFRELQTRLEREAATREILEVISQSRDDDRPVFEVVLRKAADLCGASRASLDIISEDRTNAVLTAHWGDNIADLIPVGTTVWPMSSDLAPPTCMREGRIVHVHDMVDTDLYRSGDPIRVSAVDTEGIRTFLAVPLFSGGRTVGCIEVYRREVDPFSAGEIALVETFAAQAVIAIENVRQFRELQTRLAREAATREILEVISQSRDDDRPVFDVVLRKAADLCNASLASLLITSEDRSHAVLVADWGLGQVSGLIQVGTTVWPMESGYAPSTCMREGRIVHIHDLTDTDLYRSGDPLRVAAVEEDGIRTVLAVPLFSGGQTVGCILVYRREVRPFTADEIALVETFAAQAVIAIENVRQFRELQDSLEQQEATSDILRVISQSREDETQVFDLILEKAAVLCDADQGSLIIVNEARTHVRLMADWGHNRKAWQPGSEFSLDLPLSIVATIRTAKVVHIEDYSQSDAYKDRDPIAVGLVETEGHRTRLIVPLLQNGIAIGCISLSRRAVRPFSLDGIALVETFAAQAVIAIENVRQFRELQTRLAREAATREILEVISQSRDDERPVFEVVVRKAAHLCGASLADLEIISEDRGLSVMVAHWGETLRHHVVGETAWPMDNDLANAIYNLEGRNVHVHDLADTDLYRSGDPMRVADVDKEGIRTFLAVPLFSGGKTVGCITLYRREVKPFTADDISLAETFAAQAVIAIENVRQFRELQTRLAREAATREILEVISQSRDDDAPVFDVIAQRAAGLCGAAVCTFWRVEDGLIHYCASHGLDSVASAETRLTPSTPLMDSTLTGQVVKQRAVVRIEDATAESYYDHEWARRQGLRQLIGVPILIGEDVWGSINLMWPADRAPHDADIQLVETFSAQASIAIENVRQFRELQARLAREAATKNILRVISESPDDEQPTFEVILDSATRLCGTQYASIILGRRGDASQRMVAHRAAMDETVALFRDGKVPMDPEDSIAARAILEGSTIHVPDMADTDQYRAGHERFRLVVDHQGLRTNLFVPLLGPEGGIGCLILWKKEVAPFTVDQIALMETFASHAVIAMENVRQFRELQTRLAREAATREILEVISRNPDDDRPVFDVILRNVIKLCAGDTSALLMGRKDDPRMTMAAWRDRESGSSVMDDAMIAQMNATEMLMDPTIHVSAQAIIEARNIHVLDVKQHPSYLAGEPSYRIMGDALGVRSALVVPLIDARGALGTVHVQRREVRPFTDDEIALVETFAAQAVIAIENVRQFKALEALNAELGDRVEVQVGEIERMGRLKRFLPTAVADAVVSSGSEKMLSSHRALLGVLFCDIRGFTAFCETAEPEETIEVLQTYHEEMGALINAHKAGVDHRMGDGIMVLFNDPLPCDDPAGSAVRLAMAMRARMAELCVKWKRSGYRLGFGLGVSLGYATVGMVGAGGRHDYTASGTAINLASRLCDEAQDGEILISPRAWTAIEDDFTAESRGEITFKGIREPVEVFCVTGVIA